MAAYGKAAYAGAPYAGSRVFGGNGWNNSWTQPITEIAFASNPLDDPAVWVDVSSYVESIKTNRGRQHELNRFEAGTAEIVLSNRDGRFSPFNTSSPYYPNVKPYVQVRVRALWNGQMYPIFRGHIESWPTKWSDAVNTEVTVGAVDATKILNLKSAASVSQYAATVLADRPVLYYKLNESGQGTFDSTIGAAGAALIPIVDYGSAAKNNVAVVAASASGTVGGAFLGAPGGLVASSDTSLDCADQLGQVALLASDGRVPVPPSFNIGGAWSAEMWVLVRQLRSSSSFITFPFAAGGALSPEIAVLIDQNTDNGLPRLFINDNAGNTSDNQGTYPIADGQWHHLVVTAAAGGNSFTMYVDGLQAVNVAAPSAPLNSTGTWQLIWGTSLNGQMQHLAFYSSALTATQVLNHYNAGVYPRVRELPGVRIGALLDAVGWPSSLRSIDAGTSPLQAATNDVITKGVLDNTQLVADTEGGQMFITADGKVTFYQRNRTSMSPNGLPGVTLGDSGTTGPGGESPYSIDTVAVSFDDLDLWNETVVTPSGSGAQIYGDATSQTAYGKRSRSLSTSDYSVTTALGHAQWETNVYKAPLPRVRAVSFTPMSDPDVLFPAALGFELLTRVEFRRRPKDGAGSTFDQQSLIEGVEHDITPGSWITTWRLSPTDASPMFWVIEDPVAGKVVESTTVAIGY